MKSSSMGQSKKTIKTLTYVFLILGSLIMVFPFIWMILTSLKTIEESTQIPPTIFPQAMHWKNFKDAIASLPFVRMYANTILMIFFRVICAVLFSSMAGYAFAKLNFKGKNILFALVVVQQMLPSQIVITPQ